MPLLAPLQSPILLEGWSQSLNIEHQFSANLNIMHLNSAFLPV
jgi:hypothetical protein